MKRKSVFEVEEGNLLQPKFDSNGLIPVITIDISDNQVLMHGYMNKEAFEKSISKRWLIIGREVEKNLEKR